MKNKKGKTMIALVPQELYVELKRLQKAIVKSGGSKKPIAELLVSSAQGNINGIKALTNKYEQTAISNLKSEINNS